MKKTLCIILTFILLFSVLTFFTSCNQDENPVTSSSESDNNFAESGTPSDDTVIRIAVLNGTTGFGIVPLYHDLKNGKADFSAQIDFYSDASLIPSLIVSGSADIAAVPTNLAASLYAKTQGGIRVLAVNTLGVLYILENGDSVKTLNDLCGKTVYVPGQGSNPEYVLKALLELSGIADKVTVDGTTYSSPDALTTALASGIADIGLLPEPKVTAALMQNSSLRVAVDLTPEWKNLTGCELVQGCLIARADFVSEHKDLTDRFLTAYKASVNTVNENHENAAELIVSAGLAPKAALVTKALPRCNITYMSGDEMKSALNAFWKGLHDIIPSSVGGSLPDEKIFY
ncbi:MAG: ABC transporter substrate-binding protein [Clostridia bacterium]|nr:ABC transporter substrate-binding protein [Clostridia bacterium]